MKYRFLTLLLLISSACAAQRWTAEKANTWYKSQPWYCGANFQPSTAINQLEMFQAATFDAATIDKELGMAEALGMNAMRVYLHHVAYTSDKTGFKKRLDNYLAISKKHGIKTILVFFDDCWNDEYKAGKQPEPKSGIHNSGWVRDPGTAIRNNPDSLKMLEGYVKDILNTHKNDKRVLLWDLYNEPGNSQYFDESMPLLKSVFAWAREVKPSQPVSSGVWNWGPKFANLNKFQLENSDVITYHHYGKPEEHQKKIDEYKALGRPMLCTEYMARKNGSTFQAILPLLKRENIAAINWGFVAGKTNTIFAWSSPMPGVKEPELWFHDIYRKDGSAFNDEEVKSIKQFTGKSKRD
ncbi:glycoside hydrolase family 2 TIM barrel-domain containing protein [Hufsiella ginkgonis]|uniref:Cellulase family glycosylhydrolase n=1 Tax=Hufsiella ginkgonis TaxID=2695274 RepID=A0A7K1XS25_9SPHI|nr:glycoside hydrolase family 2 TIM barrel-domain containing protein [Hufsiella ginkgonis]MXV13802.1 cellulase family glycosylhydrolase [Hufsiella ginkgonis]